MTTWAILFFMGCGSLPTAQAQSSGGRTPGNSTTTWIGGSAVQTQVLAGTGGETWVGVWLEVPEQVATTRVRAPMAISLVVDTSACMAGEKINNARMAAASMLESLRDGDIVSIYAFSTGVAEVAPPTTLSPGSRSSLMQRIQGLHAGGGTNLYAGLTTGEARLAQAPASHPVRRLMLISDGHANIGPSDAGSLGALAANGTEYGVQVSAIGVGLGYDEGLLAALAVQSAGRLYHLQHTSQMATILNQELNLLAQTVATNAWIEIIPAPGVQILSFATPGAVRHGTNMRLPLGSLYAGQEREVLFQAQVDTNRVGNRAMASARLVYQQPGQARRERQQALDLSYSVTRDRRQASASVAPRVQAMVAGHQAAQSQLRAAELLNQGQNVAAAAELERAEQQVAATSRQVRSEPQRARLRRRAQRLRQSAGRARAAGSAPAAREAALEETDSAMADYGY